MSSIYTSYKFPKFVHFFYNSEKDVGCLYNALTMETLYFEGTLYKYLIDIKIKGLENIEIFCKNNKRLEELIKKIIKKGFVIPMNFNEDKILENIAKQLSSKPKIKTMILLVTDFCNLDCKYCYIERSIPQNYERSMMSKEIAKAAINKFFQIAFKDSNTLTIVFYGGEPLLNWDVIKFSLEYLERIQKEKVITQRINKILITNGTLITREIALKLKSYDVAVAVSIDGPKEIHDRNRMYPNGIGSFENTMKGLNYLISVGIKPSISAVLSRDSLPYTREILDFFLKDLNITKIGFNHVSIVPNINDYDPDYEKEFGKFILKVHEDILKWGNKVYERRMSNKFYNFLNGNFQKADCTGCGQQIAVSPDGIIGVCQGFIGGRETYKHSVLEEEYNPNNDPVFQEWSNRYPLNMRQCWDCPSLSICGGGCPKNAYMLHGSIWERDTTYCIFAKQAIEWLIWKKI